MLTRRSLITTLVAATLALSSTAFAGEWSAIAYNSSTGYWSEYHGACDLAEAERNATNSCGPDCATVGWVQNGWTALAKGDAGWGSATSPVSPDHAVAPAQGGRGWGPPPPPRHPRRPPPPGRPQRHPVPRRRPPPRLATRLPPPPAPPAPTGPRGGAPPPPPAPPLPPHRLSAPPLAP